MKIVYEDILKSPYKYKGVTTNGFVNSKGKCIMGRGIALEIKNTYPGIDITIGTLINKSGNRVHVINLPDGNVLITLPVKPASVYVNDYKDNIVAHARNKYKPNSKAPGFLAKATIGIVKQTMEELAEYIEDNNITDNIIVPRFGCGAGELTWKEVQPFAKRILPDNVLVTTFRPNTSHIVFISVGDDIDELPFDIITLIDDVFINDLHIVLDDSKGSELVQQKLANEGYTYVTIFHNDEKPRHMVSDMFKSERIEGDILDRLAHMCASSIHLHDRLSYEKVSLLSKPTFLL